MSEKYELIHQDCVEWMNAQKDKSIDCVITSPPYNLNIKYSKYEDNLPREQYIDWLVNISENIKRILKDEGHYFLNIGATNLDPLIAMEVGTNIGKVFHLQNNFTWVKHIAVQDKGYGQYKPITSKRYVSNTTESIFHFTKTGDIAVDRLAIGQRNRTHEKYPELYSEGRHIANARRSVAKKLSYKNYTEIMENGSPNELKEFKKLLDEYLQNKPYQPDKPKCIGNAWYIPYTPTSKLSKELGATEGHNFRKVSRGNHPATFPTQLPEQCIKFSGIKKNSKVYDPFVGTGTTVLAASKLGMYGIGTDIDKDYIEFSKFRMKQEVDSKLF